MRPRLIDGFSTREVVDELIERLRRTNGIEYVRDKEFNKLVQLLEKQKGMVGKRLQTSRKIQSH